MFLKSQERQNSSLFCWDYGLKLPLNILGRTESFYLQSWDCLAHCTSTTLYFKEERLRNLYFRMDNMLTELSNLTCNFEEMENVVVKVLLFSLPFDMGLGSWGFPGLLAFLLSTASLVLFWMIIFHFELACVDCLWIELFNNLRTGPPTSAIVAEGQISSYWKLEGSGTTRLSVNMKCRNTFKKAIEFMSNFLNSHFCF